MGTKTDRRINPRFRCPESFELGIEEYPGTKGLVLNLSIGGITFIFPKKLATKSLVNFDINCLNTPFSFNAPGEIIWSRQINSEDKYISGAIFPYLDEEEVLQLREVMSLFSVEAKIDRRCENRRRVPISVSIERRKKERRKPMCSVTEH